MREIVLNAIGTNISRSRYMCIYVYVYICVPSLHSANHLEAIKCITMMGLVFRRLNRLQDALEWCRREVKVHMSHVAHMKESWHTYERVTSQIWVSRFAHMRWCREKVKGCMTCRNEVKVHMSHGTHMKEWWHTYEWVTSHICEVMVHISHGTHMKESWHTCEWVTSHTCVRRIAQTNRTHVCEVTHSYVCHDSFIWVPWLMCTLTHVYLDFITTCHDFTYVWRDSFVRVSFVRHTTYSFVCHIAHMRVGVVEHTWELVSYKGAGMQHTYIRIARALINIRIYLS